MREKHKTYFYDIKGQEKVHEVYFTDAVESGFNNSDYANGCKLNHIAEPKNALEAADVFTRGFAESLNIVEHVTDALLELGEMAEQDVELLRTDPGAFGASMFLKAGITSMETINPVVQGINTFLLVKNTIQYYTGSNASLAEKITSAGEATGTLVITLIALSADLVNLDKEGIATLMEGIKTGNLSAATLARACGDTRQMAKAAQTFFEREAAEQIADMSVSEARYLLKTGEQVQKAAGGTIRLGKTEILKLLDNFADDIAADIAAEILAAQIGKAKIMEAIESVLDKTTFETVKDAIEGRALEPAELEKLNQVIRSYSLQKGEKMSASQIRGLLKDGSFLTKSVDDVVAELVKGSDAIEKLRELRNLLLDKYQTLDTYGNKIGNIAYSTSDLEGYSLNEMKAFSKYGSKGKNGIKRPVNGWVSSVENPAYSQDVLKVNSNNEIDFINGYLRNNDTEYKIIEKYNQIFNNDYNVKGKITIVSERDMCPSCDNVVKAFSRDYSNIEIILISNSGKTYVIKDGLIQ